MRLCRVDLLAPAAARATWSSGAPPMLSPPLVDERFAVE
jgi:hypothetical protein